ncbi:PREDICTED: loricrin-like [Prunus mume]|uniref:Loricrin-like n=1 Tax=Prunus mume TaxID=102107 RepID=A0ABM1LLM8_PRUMU|nr:PREDICTED: loricrin-like [Prunus mume]
MREIREGEGSEADLAIDDGDGGLLGCAMTGLLGCAMGLCKGMGSATGCICKRREFSMGWGLISDGVGRGGGLDDGGGCRSCSGCEGGGGDGGEGGRGDRSEDCEGGRAGDGGGGSGSSGGGGEGRGGEGGSWLNDVVLAKRRSFVGSGFKKEKKERTTSILTEAGSLIISSPPPNEF